MEHLYRSLGLDVGSEDLLDDFKYLDLMQQVEDYRHRTQTDVIETISVNVPISEGLNPLSRFFSETVLKFVLIQMLLKMRIQDGIFRSRSM